MSFRVSQPVALPKSWTRHVRSGLLQAISLATTAWTPCRPKTRSTTRISSCLPVISSRLSGIPELVQDGVSGILTEPGDAEGIANALQKLREHPALRSEMGKSGRAFIRESFDLKKNARKLIKLIQK